jgi:hypothetical protein
MFLKGGTKTHATSLPRTNTMFYFRRNLLVARSHLCSSWNFSSSGLKHTYIHTHTHTHKQTHLGRVFEIHIDRGYLALLGSTTRVNTKLSMEYIYIYIYSLVEFF